MDDEIPTTICDPVLPYIVDETNPAEIVFRKLSIEKNTPINDLSYSYQR